MKKTMKFCMAFFFALGAMISFTPSASKARDLLASEKETRFDVAHYFEHVWSYLAKAVTANGKN